MAEATGTPAAGATSSSPPAIRIHDTVLVPPSSSPSAPVVPEAETSLPLTIFDIFWLNSPPVERVFIYRLAPNADADAIISNLKSSLSHAVRAFYPLAGRIRLTPGTEKRYELHYQPGDGVAFTVTEHDGQNVDALAADAAREVAALAPLLPPLPESGGVLAVQATKLTSSGRSRPGGLAVGVTVHHAACDGSGSTHFLHYWAAAAACSAGVEVGYQDLPPPPVVDRSLVSDTRGLYDVVYGARLTKDELEFAKMSPDQLLATFVLPADDLQRVKDAVAAEAAKQGVPPPRVSSLVAALGLVWCCYLRAKHPPPTNTVRATDDSDGQPTCLILPVDHRSRMHPPLPDKYLGNCAGPATAIAPKAELTVPGAGSLLGACAALAAAIARAVTEVGTPKMDTWMDWTKEVAGKMSVLSVAGSPRFRVYDVDFGFGRPAKVDIVSVARTGALALAEGRDGGGGVEVGVSLRPDDMDRFHERFADATAWLRTDRSC